MAVVYIEDQGSSISKKGDRLYIYRGPQLLRWFHTKDIEQLIIVGNISVTSPVITYLLKYRIDTVFLSYYGKYKGRLVGESGKNVALRLDQFRHLSETQNRCALAQIYIKGKIANMQVHLEKRMKRNKHPLIATAYMKNSAILKKLDAFIPVLDVLRGYEGIAAKNYFGVFKYLISNPDFKFEGRNRRPPKDEVNALLSLAYTFLMNQVMSQTYIVGLDPYYGALHDIDYGRQSLVLDLMEEFRPLIDNLVIKTVNRREIRLQHFVYNTLTDWEDEPDSSDPKASPLLPVSLTQDGMKLIVYSFAALLNSQFKISNPESMWSLKDIILMQARKLAAHLAEKKEYKAFEWI